MKFRFAPLVIMALAVFNPAALAFDPGFNGNVYASLVQSDGRIVVGGSFTAVQPSDETFSVSRQRIARLNADGSLDTTFDVVLDGDVVALALQPDGSILVGGKFAQVRIGAGGTAHARSGLLRLKADGSLDLGFDPRPVGASASSAAVSAIAVEADGGILIGGAFTSLQPHGSGSPVSRSRLARLLSDGSVDPDFSPAVNNVVFAIGLQADGRILVGGGFTSLQPTGSDTSETVGRLVRLNRDGTYDASFSPNLDNRVLGLAVQSDGRILVCGGFISVRGSGDEDDTYQPFIARFNADGGLDEGFSSNSPNASVYTVALQHDGKILVGGDFISFGTSSSGTVSRAHLARLDQSGVVDASFAAGANASVRTLAVQNDDKIMLGGVFTRVTPNGATNSVLRNRFARVLANGDLDGGFGVDAAGAAYTAALESDGSLLLGGSFRTIAGVTRAGLARLFKDGSVDPDFHPYFDGIVQAIVVQSDGKIVVGGQFSTVDDVDRSNLVRFNADGSIDTSFNPGPNAGVYALYLRSDGRILVGGAFTTFDLDDGEGDDDDGDGETDDDTYRQYLAELGSGGKLTSYNMEVNGPVNAIARQSDNRLVIGGSFSAIGVETRYDIARLSAGDEVDVSFAPNLNSSVNSIAIQSDGKIVFGGAFTTLQLDDGEGDDDDGDDDDDDDADRLRIARLNADGTLDKTFNPGFNGAVMALLPTSAGELYVGGLFTKISSTSALRNYLVRLKSDGTQDTSFEVQTNDRVYGIISGTDGTTYVYGQFTKAYTAAGDSITTSGHVIRLSAASAIDHSFGTSTSNTSGERVLALATESDGRVLVGGQFDALSGNASTNLARLYGGGSPDTSFDVPTDGAVRALLVQPQTTSAQVQVNALAWFESSGALRDSFDRSDIANLSGSIDAVLIDGDSLVVGGSFSITGSDIQHLARFSSTGQLDSTFNPAPDAAVTSLGRQSDGKIVVGGKFTTIAGGSLPYVARLNADGSLDASFAPPALNDVVATVVVQADGAIVAGGSFTSVEIDDGQTDDDDGDGTTDDDTGRHYMVRFQSDGALDKTYNPTPNAIISNLLLMSDGKIMVSGSFTTFVPNGGTTTYSRNYIALLNTDGTVQTTSFNPSPNSYVTAMVAQSDGKVIIGGSFTLLQLDDSEGDDDDGDGYTTDDADRRCLARLNADFTLDKTFDPRPDGAVQSLALDSSGRIYVGGSFLAFEPTDDTTYGHGRLARLNSDGSVDSSFNPSANGQVLVIAIAADDSAVVGGVFTNILTDSPLYVGGEFGTIGGVALPYLARLSENGTPDDTFAPAPDGVVHALAADAEGRVLVGGAFGQIAGASRSRLARFSNEGTLDGSFAPNINGTVQALTVTQGGSILIGGEFDSVDGASHQHLARLTGAGALDSSFAAQVDGTVHAIAALPDGRVLIGGEFTHVNGSAQSYLARVLADGSLDTGFNPSPNGPVYALSARADWTVLVGGDFTQIAGQSASHVAMLYSDGTPDGSFAVTADATVWVAAGLLDGTALVGGSFTTTSAGSEYLLSRLTGINAGAYAFTVGSSLNSVTWTLSGGAPQFTSVALAYSVNGNIWTTLSGVAVSSDGKTWSWSGAAALPANTPYLLRARAVAPATRGGSSGVVEVTWQFLNAQPAVAITINQGPSDSGGSGGSGGSSGDSGSGGSSSTPLDNIYSAYSSSTNAGAEGYFSDFSTLLRLHGDELHYVNLVITGGTSRRLFLRVAGPGLAAINIDDYAPAPRLELYTSAGARWLEAAGPVTDASLRDLATQLGALPLSGDLADAAALTTLAPGAYTLVVWDSSGAGGAVLVELYEADGSAPSGLVAYASRASAAVNTGVQTTEFTIKGTASRTVLVRALGPALTAQGIGGALADPQLLVQNAAGETVASNDNWGTPVATGSSEAASTAQLIAAASRVGAVALTTGSHDAAVLVSLSPGVYTTSITGPEAATGVSELEVFEVPPSTDSTSDSSSSDSSSSSSGGGGGAPSVPATVLMITLLLLHAWRQKKA